jgi:hypothetical protein
MSDERQPGVIGSLPSTRPHRRSGKRAAPSGPNEPAVAALQPVATTPKAAPRPTAAAKPKAASERKAAPKPSPARDPAPPAPAPPRTSPGALQTAVEAAAELTEIGLRASARALRVALSRLPKP